MIWKLIHKTRMAFMCGLLVALPSMGFAHSFNVLMILPSDASAETTRDDMVTAFLIASLERDDHPNNHADGHLGGLDVYLSTSTLENIKAPLTAQPDIIAAPLQNDAIVTLDELSRNQGAVLIGATSALETQKFLDQPAAPQLDPFSQRFTAQAGYPPSPQAIAAYAAARRIDLAVREIEGVSDRDKLRALLVQ